MTPATARPRPVRAERIPRLASLVLAMLAAPVAAQVPADRPTGTRDTRPAKDLVTDASVSSLVPFAGRLVSRIEITGHNVTRDWVITREIRTKVGDPLDVEAVGHDVARLDNLSIFAEIAGLDVYAQTYAGPRGAASKGDRLTLPMTLTFEMRDRRWQLR